VRRRTKTALRHGATATPDESEVAAEAEAILRDYPDTVALRADVRRAALALASARLRLTAAALNSARVRQVEPRSTFARELDMIDDLLADIVRSMPYALEAVTRRARLLGAAARIEAADRRRALRYEREARGRYRRAFEAFLRALGGPGGRSPS